LLGDAEYRLMKARLKPGQQAVLIAANGRYSFKGSGYVRGGIFDRIHVVQGEDSIRFRDRDHKRLGDVEAAGAPRFAEVALYIVPDGLILRPDKGWRVELLVARATGAIKKAFTNFSLDYLLPAKYLEPKIAPVALKTPLTLENGNTSLVLWQRIWKDRIVDVVILSLAILLLTGIFFFQGVLVRYPVLMKRIRTGFLLFTLFWIGGYAHAQLSVVNIMTIFNSVTSGFNWEFFLMDPLLFILWCSVAASVLFWGRGAYCGWLCPFGAMQELLNMLAKRVGVPQYTVPWGLHERLWPIKYMIFLPLFGLSVYSFALAETFAEIEPFKTAIVLKFAREWPFVLYALTLLAAGLFVERFFCRYLCPLGAGLAIPARLRMFEWLYRHHDCGSSCHRCAQECMVQAIHPDGKINPNECHYCLHCLEVYSDDQRCPPMIKKRQRRERRAALSGDTKTPEK
ncbi:MAG: 4Fe-4S binding protein, partial [Rhodospirillales bacterium]|nr:4Fe-4S binding protein [Rhodospirillales bacterium]